MGALSILNLKTFYLEMVKNFVLHGLGSLSISDFGTTLKLCKVWDLKLLSILNFGTNFKTLQGMGLRTLAGMGVKNNSGQNPY